MTNMQTPVPGRRVPGVKLSPNGVFVLNALPSTSDAGLGCPCH